MPDTTLPSFKLPNLFIQTRAWKGFTNASLGQSFEYTVLVILKYIIKAINFHSQYVCSKINLRATGTALLQELT